MAIANWRDFCIDANRPVELARFWSAVLDRPFEELDGGDAAIGGPTREHAIWVNSVPEQKTVKGRVHLDVYARSLGDLEALGAEVVDTECGGGRWTVMADPEGNEFCAFLRDELPAERLHGLVVDCADHASIASWWAEIYEAELVHHDEGYSTVQGIAGMPIQTMDFVPVPEAKAVKNRVHWDVTVPALEPLLERGATVLLPLGDDRRWDVLADPEGNEFCAFVREQEQK